jgi:hypothetical protein
MGAEWNRQKYLKKVRRGLWNGDREVLRVWDYDWSSFI